LLDCGLYQGHRKEAEARNLGVPFPAASVAAVVLSNALAGRSGQPPGIERGHAEAWMKPMASGLKKVFLVHGEPAASAALQQAIQATYGLETVLPTPGQSVELD
jgi:Cft2 family RNA processing exonuclease